METRQDGTTWIQEGDGSAVLSPCSRYRYLLGRRLHAPHRRVVMFLMLNPSTADAIQDDATVRRCIGFAHDWGYEVLLVANLFAYRATDPSDLQLSGWLATP